MNKAFLAKIANSHVMPTFRRCHWYSHFGAQVKLVAFGEANDDVASEQNILSKNQDYKSFHYVTVNLYLPIFWGLDARGGKNLIKYTQTKKPRCACRQLINVTHNAQVYQKLIDLE